MWVLQNLTQWVLKYVLKQELITLNELCKNMTMLYTLWVVDLYFFEIDDGDCDSFRYLNILLHNKI
jgi:hypothetical protein